MPTLALSGTGARTRTASASEVVRVHKSGAGVRARGSNATETVQVIFIAPITLGWEFNGRTRGAYATIDVTTAVVVPPDPDIVHVISTQWFTITGGPTLDANQQPISNTWPITRHGGTWGSYRIRINGQDVTFVRDAKTIVLQESDTEPFGDDTLRLLFPMIGPFEKLGVGDLSFLPSADNLDAQVAVVIEKVWLDSHRTIRWEGDIDVDEDTYDGRQGQLIVNCTGFFKTLDNRVTKPRFTNDPIDCGKLIHDFVNYEQVYGWNGHAPAIVNTGIETAERGAYGDALCSVTIQNLLAIMQRGSGVNYTITNKRSRTGIIAIKDLTTVHVSIPCGLPGVTHQLTRDRTKAFNTIFGEGQDNNTNFWRNTQYPNAPVSPPTYPLPAGAVCNVNLYCPGNSVGGLQPFSDELRTRGYPLKSRDTYLVSDEDEIRGFQQDMGASIDGIIGPQTWNRAFATGLNAHELAAYIRPLVALNHAEPFIYNSRGGIVGDNPSYTHAIRREKLEQYGPLSKRDARASSRDEMPRIYVADYAGTITVTNVDFPQMPALDVRSGMNLLYQGHRGVDRLFHIAKADRQPGDQPGQDRVCAFTVSEHGDDYVTIAARLQRDRDVVDQSGRTKAPRRTSKHSPDFAPWDSESGAGFFTPQSQFGGLWNVYPIPAGERGPITHVRLVADTDTLIAAAVFNDLVSPAALVNLPGLADPSSGAAGGLDPWQVNAAALTRLLTYADQPWMAWATGGPGAMQGYWPNTPAVGATITGVLDDSQSWQFHSARGVWLFLAVWTRDSCVISGDPAYGYRALWPGPEA